MLNPDGPQSDRAPRENNVNHRLKLVVFVALLAMGVSIFIGIGPATAASAPPPIVLSQATGQAGTTVTVTLPAACTVPAYDAPDPNAVEVLISAVNQFEDIYDPTYYAGTPGVPITQVTLAIPDSLLAGRYVISAFCNYGPGPFGDAYFTVTSATQLPILTVAPQSVGQGQVVDVTGDCVAIPGQPSAYFFVAIASATDPGAIVASDHVSGPGPTITIPITIPSTAAPGSYFITATCDDYTSVAQFAESPLTITGTVTAITLSTSLTNSLGQSGSTVTSGTNVGVTDAATLSGANAGTASGTVTYSVFSDATCSTYVGSGGTVQVTDGQVPVSSPVSLASLGTYYWQASYSGDGQNAPVTGACGSEVEDVATSLTTELSGGGQSGASITVTAGDLVTDSATLTGPGSSTASGTVSYSFYFDSGCTEPVSNSGNGAEVTVAGGSIPISGPIDLGNGTYYWQATFLTDIGKVAASTCGSEIETVTTNLATSLAGGGQSGASIAVPEGTAVTDTATFVGPAASNATGTVEYFVYSDSKCFNPVGTFGTVTVNNGVIPSSSPATFSAPGTYYWLAYYSGDSNYPISDTSCGTGGEVETVTGATSSVTVATSLSGGGQTGSSISVPANTGVTDTATLSGTNASSASGTVTYTVYSDNTCATSVKSAGTVTVSGGVVPPSSSVALTSPGTYYWQASYSGDSTNAPSTSTCGSEVETVTSVTSPVTVTTSLSGGGQSGSSISVPANTGVTDTATLSGTNASSAGGTVTYNVYSDSGCTKQLSGAQVTMAVTSGVVPPSNPVALATGTYYWQASYSGDSTNAPSTSTCGSEVETVTGATSSVTVATSLSGGGQTGSSISVPANTGVTDTATLSGTNASSASGTVTYTVYSDNTCATSVKSAGTVTVSGGVVPPSSSVALTSPGTYYWQASYSGDSTNAPSTSTCGSEVETVTSVTSPVTVTTSLSGGGQSGSSISVPANTGVTDTATLSGTNASSAGGTVTYNVYSDSGCTKQLSGAQVTMAVTSGVVPPSNPVALATGTYYWQASYSGDSTNAPSTSTCGSEVETVTGATSSVTVATSLSGGGQTGSSISVPANTGVTDTATLSGTNASSASGTVTYTVYSDNTCATSVKSVGTVTVSGGVVPPSSSVALTSPGTYYWQASYSGDSTNAPSTSTCGSEVETVTSVTSPVTVTTSLSGGGQSGSSISVPANTGVTDTATLSGTNASSAGGTVTYNVYSDSGCTKQLSGAQVTMAVTSGVVPPSNPVALATGTYYWQASYSGDSTNAPSTSTCGSEVETVTGATSSVTVATSLSGGGQTGSSISVPANTGVTDTATLSGTNASSASGTVTYTVYSDNTCATSVKSAGTVTVSGGVVPPSSSVALTSPGTYYWQASYSGDSTNAPSTSTCGSEVETVTSVTSPVTVTTSLSGGGQSGSSISVPANTGVTDTATLSGTNASSAGGTVTYNVYSDSGCTKQLSGAQVTMAVTSGVVPPSNPVALATGTYYWQASYSGDSTNAPSTSTCGSEVETVTGATSSVTVATSLSGGGQTGSSISVPANTGVTDTATLSGTNASSASGTVTYTVYSDNTCATSVKSAGTVTVSGGVVPPSSSVALTSPGTYYWQASYSGDSTNAPSTSTCGSEVETVTSVTSPVTVTTSLSGGGSRCQSQGGDKGAGGSSWSTTSTQRAAWNGKSTKGGDSTTCGGGGSCWNHASTNHNTSSGENSVGAGSTCGDHGGGQSGSSISVPANTGVTDTATLSGTNASSASGTVTYTVYSDNTCATSVKSAGTVTVSGGVVPPSSSVALTSPGTYYWQASYSGDSTNAPSTSTCGSEVETVTSVTSPVTVTTSLSGGGSRCQSQGGDKGAGGSSWSTTSTQRAAWNGKSTKGGDSTTCGGGGSCWNHASTNHNTSSGENSVGAGSTCGDHGGGQSGSSISVPANTGVTDTATLSGTNASSASGTATYTVYSDNTCATSVKSAGTVTVSGGVVPPSSSVALTSPGTYYWQASYSGDSTNAPSTSTCGSEVETVTWSSKHCEYSHLDVDELQGRGNERLEHHSFGAGEVADPYEWNARLAPYG